MTNWRDAIIELTQLGCSIRTSGNSLLVKWEGKGNPPPKEKFSSLVKVLKVHKDEILNNPYFLIEQVLGKINEIWQPGFLNCFKFSRPKKWERMLELEEEINQCAFKNDLNGLKSSLYKYRELMMEMVRQFGIPNKQGELSFQQNVCRQ